MVFFTGVLFFLYTIFLYYVSNYWRPKSLDCVDIKLNPFTILIAFRNEIKNLPKLIAALQDIKYPTDQFEVIFIDDHSEDESALYVKSALPPHARIIENEGIGKKAAINSGIKNATYNQIIQLDADGTFGSDWLSALNQYINQGAVFVTGPVAIRSPRNFLQHFQALDLMALMAITNAGIQSQKWYMANGANMTYPKELYPKQSNAHSIYASGDDMFLIATAAQSNIPINFLLNPDAIVATEPCSSWKELVAQRLRWASKNHAIEQIRLKLVLAMVLLFNVSLIIGSILDIRTGIIWGAKIILEYFYFSKLKSFYNYTLPFTYFILSAVLYPFFIFLILFLYFFKNTYTWKGRQWK